MDTPIIHQKHKFVYIYALIDPDTKAVRYIGRSVSPQDRFYGHMSKCEEGKTHCHRWLKSLKRKGKQPIMEIVEQATPNTYQEREAYWISYYRSIGAPLTNLAAGGDGALGTAHTAEAKQRMSEYAKSIGRKPPLTPEVIEKRRKKVTGRKDSTEVRKKKSDSRKGMVFDEGHKKNLKKSRKEMLNSSDGKRLADRYSREYGSLSDSQVLEVWTLATNRIMSQSKIAKKYNIPQSTVSEIKNGTKYKHVKRP